MILYIGNKLSKHGFTPTNVETLGPKLGKHFQILLISEKKNKISRFFEAIMTIIKFRKKIKLVIIDTYSTINFYYTFISALLCRLFHIPYLPILHGGGLPNRLKNSPRLSRMVFSNSFINISPSFYLMEAFQQYGFQVKYIPNYIDTAAYPYKIRENVKPNLLFVRSFHKIYNPLMAVKVLKILRNEFPEIRLCMVGPNKDGSREAVEKMAGELGVQDRLTITGKLSKEAWITLSQDYDIFINTTNFDNLPVSIIEAMCLGFPIVTTNAGGLPYLVTDKVDGMLVEIGDAQGMADCIRYILQHKAFTRGLSVKAHEKGKSFEWRNVEKEWVSLIESVGIKSAQPVTTL